MESPRLDLSSVPNSTSESSHVQDSGSKSRPFLGIRFDCCRTYGRIYRSDSGMYYKGHCPKCLKKIKVMVGEGGTGQRFFNAS